MVSVLIFNVLFHKRSNFRLVRGKNTIIISEAGDFFASGEKESKIQIATQPILPSALLC